VRRVNSQGVGGGRGQTIVRILRRGITLQARLLCLYPVPLLLVNIFRPVKTQSLHALSSVARKDGYVKTVNYFSGLFDSPLFFDSSRTLLYMVLLK
jgi:hypothetical protein